MRMLQGLLCTLALNRVASKWPLDFHPQGMGQYNGPVALATKKAAEQRCFA